MKGLVTSLLAAGLLVLAGGCATPPAKVVKQTYSSFDLPAEHPGSEAMPAGSINFQGVPADDVLKIYAELSKRTVLRGSLPDAKINLRTTTPLNRIEMLQMLDTVLAQNGIAMVLSGDQAVKAVSVSQVITANPPEIDLPWSLLPDASSPMSRTVQLKNLKAVEVVPMLAPFSTLPNSILVIQKQNLLIIRDYSSSVKSELRLLEELEKNAAPKRSA